MTPKALTTQEAKTLVANLPPSAFTKKAIVQVLNNLKTNKFSCPECLKVGDIVFSKGLKHNCVILSIQKDIVVCVGITSLNKGPFVMEACQSRFTTGYFTYTTTLMTIEEAAKGFKGVYGNRTHLRKVKRNLKAYYRRFINRV